MPYIATAAQGQSAPEALSSIDGGDVVTVTGSAGGPWTVTFGGTQKNTDVALIMGDASTATNGTLDRTKKRGHGTV